MEEEKRKAYSEVVEILKLIDVEEKIEKIPFEVIELIKSNSDPTYKPEIRKDIPLENQNLKNETYSIMAWIANKYWGENIEVAGNNQEEKANIDKLTKTTEEVKETKEMVKNAAVYNDIEPETIEKVDLPAIVPELTWYQKIKETVIRFLKMIFKTKGKEEGVNE